MALQTLFGGFAKVTGVAPTFDVLKVSTGVDPEVVFNANAPAAFTIIDFNAYNNGAGQVNAVAQLETGAGNVTDNLNIAGARAVVRATTIDPAFNAVIGTTVLTIDKNAAGDRFIAWITAFLT